jgi:hypothetical protein
VNEMREQRSGRIEFLAIDHEGIAVALEGRLEGADMFAFGLGEGVAQAIALQHPAEPKALLLFARRHSDCVQRREMILRQLSEVGVGGGNDSNDLCERSEGDASAAISLRHSDRPKARSREAIKLLGRQTSLTVSLSGFNPEFVGEPAGDSQGFLVRGDAVRIRRKIEARNLARDGDRRGNVSVHRKSWRLSV